MVFRPSNLFENLHSLLVDYFCNKMSGIALRLAGAAATRPRAGMNWEYFSLFMFQQQRSCADLGLKNNFPPHNISVFSQRNIFDYRNWLRLLMWRVEVGGCWYQTWWWAESLQCWGWCCTELSSGHSDPTCGWRTQRLPGLHRDPDLAKHCCRAEQRLHDRQHCPTLVNVVSVWFEQSPVL